MVLLGELLSSEPDIKQQGISIKEKSLYLSKVTNHARTFL